MSLPLTTFITDQLEQYGLPHQYVRTFSNWFFTSDILALAFRLALVSLLVSWLKSSVHAARVRIHNYIFVTAHIKGGSSDWIRAFMHLDPEVQAQLKQYRLSAEDAVEDDHKKKGGKRSKRASATWVQDGVCFRRAPLSYRRLVIHHQGKKLWISRWHNGYGGESTHSDHLRITTWKWNEQVITDFIMHAHEVYHDKNDSEIHIFNHTPKVANWEGPIVRPSRPWSSVILPGTVKDDLLEDVKSFVSEEEKEWYGSRGIPHRRGYLLHGPPGTGKTTMATALASKLRMDLYIVNPAAPGMDNGKLQKCFRNCPKGSLLLIEDIDCVMPLKRSRRNGGAGTADGVEDEEDNAADEEESKDPQVQAGKNDLGPSSVTLSGLLNAIDGVSSQEDSVLFASTNYPDKLDEDLRRPGRFDVHVAFDYAIPQQAADLYKHFYPAAKPSVLDEKQSNDREVADLEKRATQFANKIITDDIKVSVAAIQAYLLLHKKDATMALDKAEEWVESVRREQEASKRPKTAVNGSIWALTPPKSPN